MPVMGGMAAIRLIRDMQTKNEIIGHIPILACTANARDAQMHEMEAAGFDGIVSPSRRSWPSAEGVLRSPNLSRYQS